MATLLIHLPTAAAALARRPTLVLALTVLAVVILMIALLVALAAHSGVGPRQRRRRWSRTPDITRGGFSGGFGGFAGGSNAGKS